MAYIKAYASLDYMQLVQRLQGIYLLKSHWYISSIFQSSVYCLFFSALDIIIGTVYIAMMPRFVYAIFKNFCWQIDSQNKKCM